MVMVISRMIALGWIKGANGVDGGWLLDCKTRALINDKMES